MPVSVILGMLLKRSESITLAIPSIVFVIMLPGMLYFDLAFDIQRKQWVEILICLLPSSSAALSLSKLKFLGSSSISPIILMLGYRAYIQSRSFGYFCWVDSCCFYLQYTGFHVHCHVGD